MGSVLLAAVTPDISRVAWWWRHRWRRRGAGGAVEPGRRCVEELGTGNARRITTPAVKGRV